MSLKLGLKLLDLRQSHNLTQEQVSNLLNISRVSYSNFERGERLPDITFLLQLANYYQIDIAELINNDIFPLNMIKSTQASKRAPYQTNKINDLQAPEKLILHLKQKDISVNELLTLSKSDLDLIKKYKRLSIDDKQELNHLLKYKLNRSERKK